MQKTTEEQISRILGSKAEERLLNSFFVLYKTARIVDRKNDTFKNQSETFFNNLKPAIQNSGNVAIKLVTGRYFINEMMVRFDDRGTSGAESVVHEWKQLGIGGVEFSADITKEGAENFFIFMASIKPNDENVDSLIAKLKSQNLTYIKLLSLSELQKDHSAISENVRKQFRQAARQTFFRAMSVAQEAMVNTAQGQEVSTTKTKRVVHNLIDHISRDESSLIELAAIKDYDDYTYAHSTNVCIYSLTLGVRLKMDRARLSQLGFAALFHDVGKVKLPTDLIRKPDAYDENDWLQMQQHPLLGTKTILRNMKLDIHTARGARGAFEHHINQDFTGYPQLKYKKRPTNLFSKIIAITDSFDALCSGRVYVKKPIPPDEVLKKMHYQMKVKYDPFLLKIFTNIVGIYPAGSLVLLSTEELALILTNNADDPSKPCVKLVGNKDGLLENPVWADLSLPENAERSIVRMVDPARYGLQVKDFILGD
jgi:HD-GYP domain-containing protein (c-di-GMP phosphodiesterase class II)